MRAGATTTRFLESLPFTPKAIEVVAPGMNTTVQVRCLAFCLQRPNLPFIAHNAFLTLNSQEA